MFLSQLGFTTTRLYLGILCDELQKWDRFPAGERHIVDLQSFEKYCTDSERIAVEGQWDGEAVTFCLEEEELANGINEALKRLATIENFVKVIPMVADEESTSGNGELRAEEQQSPPPDPGPPPPA